MKKLLALTLATAMTIGMAACSGDAASSGAASSGAAGSSTAPAAGGDAKGGSVYFLNFKPEVAEVYDEIAKAYTAETGVQVKVGTAAGGTYEQTLKSEIAKKDAPTIFQINGPVGYASWKDYCADISGTPLYEHLTDKSLAIKDGDAVYGIPFAIEGYGLIYNKTIMDKYFAMDGAKAKSIDEIKSFDTLKAVAEDMQAKKADLGIEGAFASTSLVPGHEWRWHTHLANVPLYYEFKEKNLDLSDPANTMKIDFKYGANFKNLFDLYLNNSLTDPKQLGNKSVDDAMAEFALGKVAMVQNGNWAYGQIAGISGNTVKPEDVKFMPLYTGIAGEDKQGLCIGTENFFCINKEASEADQQASIDFLTWLYTSDTGKDFVTNKLGFIAPFDSFSDAEKPKDPLAQEVLAWNTNTAVTNVPWNFTIFPSQAYKDEWGAALLQYAQGSKTWDEVTAMVVSQWEVEKANTAG